MKKNRILVLKSIFKCENRILGVIVGTSAVLDFFNSTKKKNRFFLLRIFWKFIRKITAENSGPQRGGSCTSTPKSQILDKNRKFSIFPKMLKMMQKRLIVR